MAWVCRTPAWVRGLKTSAPPCRNWYVLSHPAWVRGLKLNNYDRIPCVCGRILRERGLKQGNEKWALVLVPALIAHPYMGAWIENRQIRRRTMIRVALCVGAWIETQLRAKTRLHMSHPYVVRGLKLPDNPKLVLRCCQSHPYMSAWIGNDHKKKKN